MCSDRSAADHRHSALQNGKENRYSSPVHQVTVRSDDVTFNLVLSLPPTHQFCHHAPSEVSRRSLHPQRQRWSDSARPAAVPSGDGESQHLPRRSATRATHRHLQRPARLTQPVA